MRHQRWFRVLTLALVALAPIHPAFATGGDSDFGWVACRHDGVLEVNGWIAQDEGGTKGVRRRFLLGPSQPQAATDGGVACPGRDAEGREWQPDAGWDVLTPMPVDIDVRLTPAEPTADELDAFAREGVSLLPLSASWDTPSRVRLLRGLELRSTRGGGPWRRLELNASPIQLQAFDVGDGRHALIVVRWVFTFNEGAPVRDLDFAVLPVSAPRRGRDARAAWDVAVPAAEFGWTEVARWTRAVAKGLERRRAPRAAEFRALATRRERQLKLAQTAAFQNVEKACLAAVTDLAAGERRWGALQAAVDTLRTGTAPADWPLVVDHLRWEHSDCGRRVDGLYDTGR